jgi:hypothetical protein
MPPMCGLREEKARKRLKGNILASSLSGVGFLENVSRGTSVIYPQLNYMINKI